MVVHVWHPGCLLALAVTLGSTRRCRVCLWSFNVFWAGGLATEILLGVRAGYTFNLLSQYGVLIVSDMSMTCSVVNGCLRECPTGLGEAEVR